MKPAAVLGAKRPRINAKISAADDSETNHDKESWFRVFVGRESNRPDTAVF